MDILQCGGIKKLCWLVECGFGGCWMCGCGLLYGIFIVYLSYIYGIFIVYLWYIYSIFMVC